MNLVLENKKLNDPSLPLNLGAQELDHPTIVDTKLGEDQLSITMGASGQADLFLFNSNQDKDDDKIFGADGAPIPFRENKAWLKYRCMAQIKAAASGSFDYGKIGIDTESKLVSSVYKEHDSNATVPAAIVTDVANLNNIFSLESIKKLKPNEAVSLQYQGSVQGNIKVSWADIFTSSLKIFSKWLDVNEVLHVDIGYSASVSFEVTIKDAFTNTIVKTDSDAYQISIHKSKSRSAKGAIAVEVTAKILDSENIGPIIDQMSDAIFDTTSEELKAIIEKNILSELSEKQLKIVQKISERLKWDAEQPLDLFKENYTNQINKIKSTILKIANQTLEIKAGYAYERLSESDTVFECNIKGSTLELFHKAILWSRTSEIITGYRKDPSLFNALAFLKTDVLSVTKTWGFGLKVGSLLSFGDENRKIWRKSQRENEKGIQQINYEGIRSYENTFQNDALAWEIDFSASMNKMANHSGTPILSDFAYALGMNLHQKAKNLTTQKLEQFVSEGINWGILPPDYMDQALPDLFKKLKDKQDFDMQIQLVVDAGVFHPLLLSLYSVVKNNNNFIADALGRSMPYWKDFPLRTNHELMSKYYGAAWLLYYNDPYATVQIYADALARTLKKAGYKGLAQYEKNQNTGGRGVYSLASNMRNNPATAENWANFVEGLRMLLAGISNNEKTTHEPQIKNIFEAMEDFWKYPLHVRALGSALTVVGDQLPLLKDKIQKTAIIKYLDNNEEKIALLTKS